MHEIQRERNEDLKQRERERGREREKEGEEKRCKKKDKREKRKKERITQKKHFCLKEDRQSPSFRELLRNYTANGYKKELLTLKLVAIFFIDYMFEIFILKVKYHIVNESFVFYTRRRAEKSNIFSSNGLQPEIEQPAFRVSLGWIDSTSSLPLIN